MDTFKSVLALAFVPLAGGPALAQSGDVAPATQKDTACAALAQVALEPAASRIVLARIAPASSAVTDGNRQHGPLPENCEVLGRINDRQGALGQHYAISFRLRLPAAWNRRLFFQGGGGSNGILGDTAGTLMGGRPEAALALGYAVISQDSGHDNAANDDPARQGQVTFGFDAEARRNYGGASIGPVVRAGKRLITAYYGRAPELTYYVGGSKGGQEAMMAAQRYPQEFDAVLVGYPGFRLAYAGAVAQIWDAQAFASAAKAMGQIGGDGQPLANRSFSDQDLLLVSDTVIAACDSLDGTRDGMIENFPACTTRRVIPRLRAHECRSAKQDDCLLAVQIEALRKVCEGVRGADGKPLYADWPWDAGIAARTPRGVSQGWRAWKLGSFASSVNDSRAIVLGGASASAVFTSPPQPVANTPGDLTRYVLAADPRRNAVLARRKWGKFNESSVDFMNAEATDLSPFYKRGGKMLIYHGVSDPVFSINDTIAWLGKVNAREQGHAGRFVRLFAVPGLNHGGGGPATDQFDAFSALVAWRERAVPPEAIMATAGPNTPWPGRTRLLCPYPLQPRRIADDIEQAASFRCQAIKTEDHP